MIFRNRSYFSLNHHDKAKRISLVLNFFYLFNSAQRTSKVEATLYLALLLGLGSQDDTHTTFNIEQNPMWNFKANEGGTTSSYIV